MNYAQPSIIFMNIQ